MCVVSSNRTHLLLVLKSNTSKEWEVIRGVLV